MRGLLKSKSKRGEEVLTPIIIFIVLNLIFFASVFALLNKSSKGALIYEQAYSKQIAMLIDSAEGPLPITFKVNFLDGFRIIKDSNLNRDNAVRIDKENNLVIVDLGRSKGGYGTKFFSNYDISVYPQDNEFYIVLNNFREEDDN